MSGRPCRTHRERAITALTGGQPDRVPAFELEFQLTRELLGRRFFGEVDPAGCAGGERDRLLHEIAETQVMVAERLDHDIICIPHWGGDKEATFALAAMVRRIAGDEYALWTHAGGTFEIPSGEQMLDFVYGLHDRPAEMHALARERAERGKVWGRRCLDAGIEVLGMCEDYCFNQGPFLSPAMFAEFVAPYLAEIIASHRAAGGYVIKHTDGNIMPILDQLVAAGPHALHSLDPMAGVDIAAVKALVGKKVCLIGNVNCALMQTGTPAEIRANAEYAMKHGKPGGGYIFSTSNVVFKGMPLESYRLIHEVWRRERQYDAPPDLCE